MKLSADDVLDSKETFDFLKGAKREKVKVAMIEYARRACSKQRDICAERAEAYETDVLMSPEPELI